MEDIQQQKNKKRKTDWNINHKGNEGLEDRVDDVLLKLRQNQTGN